MQSRDSARDAIFKNEDALPQVNAILGNARALAASELTDASNA